MRSRRLLLTLLIAHAIDRPATIAQCTRPYGGNSEPILEALEAAGVACDDQVTPIDLTTEYEKP
jgi:hypothetical protein